MNTPYKDIDTSTHGQTDMRDIHTYRRIIENDRDNTPCHDDNDYDKLDDDDVDENMMIIISIV